MKKYKKIACILAGSMTMSFFAGCIGNGDVVPEEKNESKDTEEPTASETSQEIKKAESRDIDQVHLRDKDSLYENDDDTSVVTMYLTVSKGNSSENTDHTWEEINSYSAFFISCDVSDAVGSSVSVLSFFSSGTTSPFPIQPAKRHRR